MKASKTILNTVLVSVIRLVLLLFSVGIFHQVNACINFPRATTQEKTTPTPQWKSKITASPSIHFTGTIELSSSDTTDLSAKTLSTTSNTVVNTRTSRHSGKSLPLGATVGASVGIPVISIIAATIVICVIMNRKKHKKDPLTSVVNDNGSLPGQNNLDKNGVRYEEATNVLSENNEYYNEDSVKVNLNGENKVDAENRLVYNVFYERNVINAPNQNEQQSTSSDGENEDKERITDDAHSITYENCDQKTIKGYTNQATDQDAQMVYNDVYVT